MALRLRPVNMTEQPAFDPNTQRVVQTGWTVGPTDLQPVWQVVSLFASQQQEVAADTLWTSTLAGNLVTAFKAYINTAVPSQAATNQVVLQLVKAVNGLLQDKYGVTN